MKLIAIKGLLYQQTQGFRLEIELQAFKLWVSVTQVHPAIQSSP